ncbi:excinuclease ABC subunit UvrA [bacterium]|nr:excinuclease ABC subunit UvrA [bacterium]
MDNYIKVIGARQNNLKGFDCKIPLNQTTVITGVSGSGKSSLAFDTIYAEGQRRYIETFSPYARQFMERMDKPRVDRIEGIPPAIAIEQGNPVRTSRSTVGTITELTDFTKLLFASIGELHCRNCSQKVVRDTPDTIWDALSNEALIPESSAKGDKNRSLMHESSVKVHEDKSKRVASNEKPSVRMILAFPFKRGDLDPEQAKEKLLSEGFLRILEGEDVVDIERSMTDPEIINVVVDRITFKPDERSRVIDSIEQALRFGNGHAIISIEGGKTLRFSAHLHCPYCDIYYKDPVPNLFSFNSPLGACPTCRGFGRVIDIDIDQVIPNPNLPLELGAIKPWDMDTREHKMLMRFCLHNGIPVDVPFRKLDDDQKHAIIEGGKGFHGIRGFFKWLETKAYKMHVRVFLSHYRGYFTCPDCMGTRFRKESLLYKIKGLDIARIYALSIGHAFELFTGLSDEMMDNASGMILREITSRLRYLTQVGLSYLTLDRQSRTLSGGEVERVSLTKAIGSSLVDTLYVLDEPSVGLHARDSKRLVSLLKELSSQNTVVVVEHDPEIIAGCDNLLDLGPGAGESGGSIVYSGPISGIDAAEGSDTIDYLIGNKHITVPQKRRQPDIKRCIRIRGCKEHNLKDINVRIPLGMMVCLTGVSGSGKSTLAKEIIYKGIRRETRFSSERPGAYDSMEGLDGIQNTVLIDQSPVGKTPRSNPISYIGALDPIRKLLAQTSLARQRKYRPGIFSFNVSGGRCEACMGMGYEKVEMQFLSDVFVTCPECKGLRFKKEALDVRYKGKNIGDILLMTFSEALDFFEKSPKITEFFRPIIEVGLGYLRLGQPINTLSGGEAQRIKLSKYLGIRPGKHILYIFDEPTTGLHFSDVKILLKAFDRLIDAGNSILIIEHNMDVIKYSDYIIDLGPEGGDEGGKIVAEGPPEAIARTTHSHTGNFLRRYLEVPAPVMNPPCYMGQSISGSEIMTPNILDSEIMTPSHTTMGRTIPGSEIKSLERLPAIASAPSNGKIDITGAREHNLKNIHITIPRNKMVVITGISGSGKSTLAFDVLFAEGQRRYIESLPTYVRQYLKIMERPDVDIITGIPPTVAIEQRMSLLHRRSTVATITEIYHYLRLLFSKLGTQHCKCGRPIAPQSEGQMLNRIMEDFKGQEIFIMAPKVIKRKGIYKEVFEQAKKKGYKQARVDGILANVDAPPDLERYKDHSIEIITERLKITSENAAQIAGSIKQAIVEGNGQFYAMDIHGNLEETFSIKGFCPQCGDVYEDIDPRLFSFNSRYGACPLCDGLGTVSGNGIPCPGCVGKRLNEKALSIMIAGHSIADMTSLDVNESARFFPAIRFSDREAAIAGLIIPEIIARLEFLDRVGLSYLTLDRSGDTLSGGETQRIRISAQLGSNLRGVCYILDEPTIGLHPRDNQALIDTLLSLRDRGNSIVVVEHDEETICRADHILDLGPQAGIHGGRVIAQGTPVSIQGNPESITGKWLAARGRRSISSRFRKAKEGKWLSIRGASVFNLRGIDADIPIGTLVCITGVSGSGKSTLLREVIFKGIKSLLNKEGLPENICSDIEGWQSFDSILEVDHSPIGKTPRSTPGTYIGFHGTIRRLFAMLPESRMLGYGPGRFSFNVKGGRCEACAGQGRIRVEMSFLPEVYIDCEVCGGKRFNEETLGVSYRGKNVADCLNMTIEEGLSLFINIPRIAKPFRLLVDMGLGYLRIGQPSNTLSGGEAQRIKLAYELNKAAHGRTLYILDEPTTGLHLADIEKLMAVLQKLVDLGNTVIIIEHNLEVIKEADHIIDLGPEGGDGGGSLVAKGSPADIICHPSGISHTARFLKRYLTVS